MGASTLNPYLAGAVSGAATEYFSGGGLGDIGEQALVGGFTAGLAASLGNAAASTVATEAAENAQHFAASFAGGLGGGLFH